MKELQRRRLILSLLPMFVLILIVYLIPLFSILVNAFIGFGGSRAGKFVGFANFRRISDEIPKSILTTIIWTMGSVLPALFVGLILALLFQENFKLKKVFLTLNLLPYSIPLIIVASCWMFIYNQNFGLLNVLLKKFGVITNSILFLNYKNALVSVIIARFWRALPFAFINFYAALTTIPVEFYEAASVDGASSFQKLIKITLPHLRSITSTTLIVLTVWTFLVFDIIHGMTGGGPVDATRIISVQIYRELFNMKDLGAASCWSLIAITILLAITILYWFILKGGKEND
jgi:multiple sugar transport system permease protein